MVISLQKYFFRETEKTILTHGAFEVSAFRYPSGVEALRVRGKRCEAVFLPYQGQQIWRCAFDGRELAMKSIFDAPVETSDYLSTYGGFLLHCGATAMGVPSKNDTHPLHGELPNARYSDAYVECGEDASGKWISVGGSYRHAVAFNHDYVASPRVTLGENATLLEIEMNIKNQKRTEMELMYLAHINFRPCNDATLAYSADYASESVEIETNVPSHLKSSSPIEDYKAFLHRLRDNPALHHTMGKEMLFDPEVVMKIKYKTDADGFAHSIQLRPDGSADYVCHDAVAMDTGVRWISRTPDQDALGLVLPANAGKEGYLREKALGSVKTLGPGKTARFCMRAGVLNESEAREMKQKIDKIAGRA
ncbi:MAG: DUF4432 family protein [Defluviitaleaceae bacterium]|nr:DUF4432 family protein [Defluviitaleaceae bacterium]